MNWSRLLQPAEYAVLFVLVAAHASLHFLDCFFGPNSGLLVLRDALPFCQFALLLIWFVVGPSLWRVRVPLVLCWVIFAGLMVWRPYLISISRSSALTAQTPLFFDAAVMWSPMSSIVRQTVTGQSVLISMALLIIRFRGFALRRVAGPDGRALQFSLRTLMCLTGASAVAIWLVQWLRNHFDTSITVPEILGVASLSTTFAAVALMAVWAAFGGTSVLLRLAIFCTATLVLGALPPYVCHRERDLSAMMSWVNAYGVLVVGSLLVVRACGYRLVRTTRGALQLPPEGAARKKLIAASAKG